MTDDNTTTQPTAITTGTLAYLGLILDCTELDATDKLIMVTLADHVDAAHECWPALATIAQRAGCSKATVKRRLGVLDDRGFVSREARQRANGGNSTTLYRLHRDRLLTPRAHFDPGVTQMSPPYKYPEMNHPPEVHTDPPTHDSAPTPEDTLPGVEMTLASSTAPTTPRDDESDLFVEFYERAYPRRQGRGAARKAWAKAIKAGHDPVLIIDAARRFAADRNRVDKYTPHPSTWLNQERWDDDPLPGTQTDQRSRSLTAGWVAQRMIDRGEDPTAIVAWGGGQ